MTGAGMTTQIRAMQDWHYSWAVETIRVLKPGGHLLAFGGTRTYHRLACALEDAGFEIRDTLCWMHGQGFPKGLDVSKQIDKQAGAERKVVRQVRTKSGGTENLNKHNHVDHEYRPGDYQKGENVLDVTAPATDAARQWDGWNVALKPAFEPIVLARKPLSESNVAANVLKWGTGAINIGDCRIGLNGDYKCGANGRPSQTGLGDNYDSEKANQHSPVGRWPANVLLSHHPDCRMAGTKQVKGIGGGKSSGDNAFGQDSGWNDHNNRPTEIARQLDADGLEEVEAWDCHPDCPCAMLDRQAGITTNTRHMSYKRGGGEFIDGIPSQPEKAWFKTETGGPSRFFYQAKASRQGRWFYCRDCQSAHCETDRAAHAHGHLNEAGKQDWSHVVAHPTVKPVELIRYLVRLVTPPNGLILDCFLGTGTTAVAAQEEGFRIVGMEQDAEYLEIVKARIDAKRQAEIERFPLFEQPDKKQRELVL